MDWLRLSNRIETARGLSLSEWIALVEAWWLMIFFHLALRVASYDRLADSARRADSPARGKFRAGAERLPHLVHLAARIHFIPAACLVQSLVLKNMLQRRNIPAQVCIGARKENGALRAHAWVEVDGTPFGEADDVTGRFSALRQPHRDAANAC